MAGPAIEVVNVAEQITSQIAWWIDEVAEQYDLSAWHIFIYGYPERAALEIRITAPDRVKSKRSFSHRTLNAMGIRSFIEDEYDKWRNRASRR